MPSMPDRDAIPETVATYLRLRGLQPSAAGMRRRRRQRDPGDDAPFTPGRDPRGLGDVIDAFTRESGWDASLAREDVVLRWAEVAGPETATHATPVGFLDGLLTVQCASTAWATQLRTLRSRILSEIVRRYPDAGVTDIRFVGPDVPSWKWGPRTVPGRGPRDTYG
jgi:predicted nucleic acid-binding Zn ribbon protein